MGGIGQHRRAVTHLPLPLLRVGFSFLSVDMFPIFFGQRVFRDSLGRLDRVRSREEKEERAGAGQASAAQAFASVAAVLFFQSHFSTP